MENKLTRMRVDIRYTTASGTRMESGYASHAVGLEKPHDPQLVLLEALQELVRLGAVAGLEAQIIQRVNKQLTSVREDPVMQSQIVIVKG